MRIKAILNGGVFIDAKEKFIIHFGKEGEQYLPF